ncbi:hypothetical protein MMC25_006150 [Agyrium rufum]|nr:hypothetical protein [Agyrium rufum]
MPVTLLPASAAAFAPRASPNIVLKTKVEPWLTQTLKRANKVKRPLNNVTQHTRCLTEILSTPTAIWTLCSIMFPKAPESEYISDPNPLVEALHNYQLIQVEAYVVHVDMVSQNEVAFKLTPETIESLVEYHKDVFSVDESANTWSWAEKEVHLKKLQEDFVQAANKYVYRTNAMALEGLEEDGAGELLCGRSEEVKNAILGLYLKLLPPPPPKPAPEPIRHAPILPSSTGADDWWRQLQMPHYMPAESWQVVPSSPSNASSVDSNPSVWATSSSAASSVESMPTMWSSSTSTSYESHPCTTSAPMDSYSSMWSHMSEADYQIPSPAPSYSQAAYSQPYTTASYSAPQYYSTPMSYAMTSSLPLPSMLTQQCSTGADFGSFDLNRSHEFFMPWATTI